MADLGSLVDWRPWVRGIVMGFRSLTNVFDALIDIIPGVIRAKHNDDGSFGFVREVALVTGNYLYNSGTGKFELQKQASDNALLPSTITPTAAGDLTITFASLLPEATYDVKLCAARGSDNKPGNVCWDESAKTDAALRVLMTNASNVGENLKAFSIELKFGN